MHVSKVKFLLINNALCCVFSLNFREFQFAQAMVYAIEEINNWKLLPNHTLGYKIYNACGYINILKSAITLINGETYNCNKPERVQAIIGHSGSTPTIGFARILGRFDIPVVRDTLLLPI